MKHHIDKIISIDWNQYSGPKYYDSEKACSAMVNLVSLSKESQNAATYNEVLFAIGNNHGGTYYPAIQGALHIIISVALSNEVEVSRNCALNMLIDIYASFDAEIGGYAYLNEKELEDWVSATVNLVESELTSVYNDTSESERNRKLASELIECIQEK